MSKNAFDVSDVNNLAYTSQLIFTIEHKEILLKVLNAMEETFINGHDYFVRDLKTIADFAFYSSIATLLAVGFSLRDFSRIQGWFKRIKSLKGFDQLQSGAAAYGDFVKSRLNNSLDDF